MLIKINEMQWINAKRITELKVDFIVSCGNIPYTDNYFEENNLIHEDNKEDIKRVVDRFKDFTSTDLVTLTQSQTPWKRVYTPFADNIITNESIKEYFNR